MIDLAFLAVAFFTAGFYMVLGGDIPEESLGSLRVNMVRLLWAFLSFAGIYSLSRNGLAAVSVALAGWMVPSWIAATRKTKLTGQVRAQLRDLVATLLGLFRNQRTGGSALASAGERLPSPLGPDVSGLATEESHKAYPDYGRVFDRLYAKYGLKEFRKLAMLIKVASTAGSVRVAAAIAWLGEDMDQKQELNAGREAQTHEMNWILRASAVLSLVAVVYGALHPGNFSGLIGYLVYGLATAWAVGIVMYAFSGG